MILFFSKASLLFIVSIMFYHYNCVIVINEFTNLRFYWMYLALLIYLSFFEVMSILIVPYLVTLVSIAFGNHFPISLCSRMGSAFSFLILVEFIINIDHIASNGVALVLTPHCFSSKIVESCLILLISAFIFLMNRCFIYLFYSFFLFQI